MTSTDSGTYPNSEMAYAEENIEVLADDPARPPSEGAHMPERPAFHPKDCRAVARGHVQSMIARYNAGSAVMPTASSATRQRGLEIEIEPRKAFSASRSRLTREKSSCSNKGKGATEQEEHPGDPEKHVRFDVRAVVAGFDESAEVKTEEDAGEDDRVDAEQDWVMVEVDAELKELALVRGNRTTLRHAASVMRSCLLALRSER
ncbi:hypothetical protein LTR15_001453 [Elasticomyces elasticus]|nr:hypothetical protein LTR15_001453 [Elasticomyces elasticus]